MLMRGGQGNDGIRNIEQTALGELAVQCPACPHPDINLPLDWNNLENPDSFIYFLFIAINACFCLKRKLVSSLAKDPYLQPGKAYFVDPEPYREFLLSVTDQDEMSTCTGLAALDYANTKLSKGYAITGIGMCCCARHELVGKNATAPLQKGERQFRYANIDYAIASFLQHVHFLLRLVLSYDIMCQWFKKCVEHLKNLPPNVRYYLVRSMVKFLIPKLHIYGHLRECQDEFSFNLTPGVGRTDAEGIERTWANMGPVATSTKEMGPGSHADTLEDHWGHWNWRKIVGMAELFRRRLLTAIEELANQEDSFCKFSSAQLEHIASWMEAVSKSEGGESNENPYSIPKSGLGLQDIRAQIAAEDALEAKKSHMGSIEDLIEDSELSGNSPEKPVTAAEFLMLALETEENQRQIKLDSSSIRNPTPQQTAAFTENRNHLMRKIGRIRQLQAVHCRPALQTLPLHPAVVSSQSSLEPEATPLILPSDLPITLSIEPLQKLELHLRDGQLQDALDQLRNNLLVKTRLHTYKKSNARRQGATTRTRSRMDRHERKIKLATSRYQHAWNAKLALVDGNKDNVGWHQLQQRDVRTMYDVEEAERKNKKKLKSAKRKRKSDEESGSDVDERKDEGEGFRKLSWIWMGADNTDMATDGLLHAGRSSFQLFISVSD
ncbi:hypothetical protein BT96DRAFT_836658 [Gymnopus androsaceus JB14]|uniref:CxC2-like cysteine cluster KDZ transposase-associated domain-containing protein n=1 Tax=Gymnopus androsaceus JB14 TaxID=1447944 RepID=A0A6A4GSP7_9AGAR|nr:hypothetical protein BT96DRAFT_836658 [Gymnopus androsaceus JB14]